MNKKKTYRFLDCRIPHFAVVTPGNQTLPTFHVVFGQGSNSGESEKDRIRAQRRRRSGPSDSGERRRAEIPRRKTDGQSRQRSSSSRGTTQDDGSPVPTPRRSVRPSRTAGSTPPQYPSLGQIKLSGRTLLILLLLFLAAVCCFIVFLSFAPDLNLGDMGVMLTPPPGDFFEEVNPTKEQPDTDPPSALDDFKPPAETGDGQTWLVMLYQDADDKILEHDIYVDLNEAERVGSSDRVHIVTQIDRFRAGYQGDGDWYSTKRLYLTQDNDLNHVNSQLVEDLGEVNMADGETLVDFVTWAVETIPADKYVLIMSDHGMGWPGGWSDSSPGGRGDPTIPLANRLGDELYLMEIDAALEKIRAQTTVDKFELIGMDACLMAHLEVFSALSPHARYAVASQETEPALGWAYAGFLQSLVDNPDMDGAELGRFIVDSYIDDDQRIVDAQARAELLRQGSAMGGLFGASQFSAEQLARQMTRDITLTAVDLSRIPDLISSLNTLSYNLQDTSQQDIARARTYAQSFTSIFGKNVPPSYIDLGNLVYLLTQQNVDSDIVGAANQVISALDSAVVAEKHGPNKPGATGISLYFPNSQLYQSPLTGPQSYTAIADRFAYDSLWDEFLAFHYTGRSFDLEPGAAAVPETSEPVTGPGAGPIQVSPLRFSDDVASPGHPVLLSADITGQNVGYVYLYVGFYDPAANSLFVADMDYLESAGIREMGGVYYPDWGESGDFTMEYEWEPILFAINDGINSVVALFSPLRYGAAPEDAVYTVEGIYYFADSEEARYARLYFRDGYLRQVFGFTEQDGTGAPREILPQTGDQFTVLERWMDLDRNGRTVDAAMQEGGTLTYRNQMFEWETLDAAIGDYVVGFVIEDLDGNRYPVYETITVE